MKEINKLIMKNLTDQLDNASYYKIKSIHHQFELNYNFIDYINKLIKQNNYKKYFDVISINNSEVKTCNVGAEHKQIGENFYGYAYFETTDSKEYYIPIKLSGELVLSSYIWNDFDIPDNIKYGG